MITFPNAKINIGLRVLSKLPDNYHRLETIIYPVQLHDILEVVISEKKESRFQLSGMELEDSPVSENLAVKAFNLLNAHYNLPAINMHLHKGIPAGAGLGGGSSDAAAVLKLINKLFELDISSDRLKDFAARLGMDCPFFIDNQPALATGRGAILDKTPVNLQGFFLLLVKPAISINTGWAYSKITPDDNKISLKNLHSLPVREWKEMAINDFEGPIFEKFPLLEKIKISLYNLGAVYAAMSGSGSSLFGIFDQKPENTEDLFPGCFTFTTEL